MNEEEKKFYVIAGVVFIAAAWFAGKDYNKTLRTERLKRNGIVSWEHEGIACIKNSEKRLLKIVNSPGPLSWDEFNAAMDEENAFLNIVINQPPF